MLIEFEYPGTSPVNPPAKTWINPLHVSGVAADTNGNTVISLNNGQIVFVAGSAEDAVKRINKAV